MELFKASKITEFEGGIHLLEFSNFNLKGYIPARLLNMVLGSLMSKGIIDFYDQLKKLES